MADTSGEFINATLYLDCLKEYPAGFIFWSLIIALCFLLGTPGQLWCLWFYFRTEQKIKGTQVFLLNHTIMELVYCMECGLATLSMFMDNNDALIYLTFFFFGLSWTGRPLLQTCICIEQYLAVLHPVTFLRYKCIKYRIAAAGAAWLMAFGYSVYEIYTLKFPNLIYAFVFIITLVVISFCCVSVLRALKQPGPGDTRTTNQTGRDVGNRQKTNAFNTIFSSLLLILLTYAPQALLIVFTNTGIDQLLLDCVIVPFFTSLNVFGVIIMPVLKLYKESHQKSSV